MHFTIVRRERRCEGFEPGAECTIRQSGVELWVVFGYAPVTALESDQGQEKSRSQSHSKRQKLSGLLGTEQERLLYPVCFFCLLGGIFGSDESLERLVHIDAGDRRGRGLFREAESNQVVKSP